MKRMTSNKSQLDKMCIQNGGHNWHRWIFATTVASRTVKEDASSEMKAKVTSLALSMLCATIPIIWMSSCNDGGKVSPACTGGAQSDGSTASGGSTATGGLTATGGSTRTSPTDAEPSSNEKVITAARELIGTLKYCALITVDGNGQPQVRTMNPFPPEDDMSVWMATTTKSRKYAEIQKNPRVTLYYANHAEATGYVSLTGRAVLVEDMEEVLKRKRAYWDQSFPGLQNIALIHVIPERMEVVYYKAGLVGNPETFAPTAIDLTPPEIPTAPNP